jgi:hypothetical protein
VKDTRTVVIADVAADLREMLGDEFDLYFVERPAAEATGDSACV